MPSTGEKIPDFSLSSFEGDEVTPESLAGKRALFCFYPFAFSGVCTDQFSLYQKAIDEFKKRDVEIYAISIDQPNAANAFKESLGVTDITFICDWEPKGEVAKAFETYRDGGFNDRSVYEITPDGTFGWTTKMPNPGEFPDVETVLAGLDG